MKTFKKYNCDEPAMLAVTIIGREDLVLVSKSVLNTRLIILITNLSKKISVRIGRNGAFRGFSLLNGPAQGYSINFPELMTFRSRGFSIRRTTMPFTTAVIGLCILSFNTQTTCISSELCSDMV